MKIRNGFVSNSSSSSFCIYGASLSKYSIMEEKTFMDFAKKELKTRNQDDEDCEIDEEDLDFGTISSILEDVLNKFNLSGLYEPYDWTTTFIGRSWTSLKDEETAGEFKKSIQSGVEDFFKQYLPGVEPSDCRTHQESWHD